MKTRYLISAIIMSLVCAFAAAAQMAVVIVDPTKEVAGEPKLSTTQQQMFDSDILPKVRKMVALDICDQEMIVSGIIQGAFTKAGSQQTLIFYQYCQTGNGLGWVGIVVFDGGKVVGNFIADSGWSLDAASLPDINGNGLDEFTLSYGGGMHQGQGGVGVDVMEFAGGMPKGLGWFKAEEFMDTETVNVWKVTAKPGKVPVYYKQKYAALEGGKYRRVGANTAFKLTKAVANFKVVK